MQVSSSMRWREEVRAVSRLAWPIMISQFAQTANGFVDNVMAGQASAADLAAVALGTSIWLPAFLFMVGFLSAGSALVSHAYGGQRYADIGRITQLTLLLALPLGVGMMWLLRNASPILSWMGAESHLIPLTDAYLEATAWGFPAISLFLALRFHAEGMGHTRAVMVVSVAGLLINIPADYLFVFGGAGIPAMGGEGCGWATALVMWLMFAGMAVSVLTLEKNRPTGLRCRPVLPTHRAMVGFVRLGVPIGLMLFVEATIFCVIALLISGLGVTTIAAHQIALNVSGLLFMLPLSVSLALAIRAGHHLGARDHAGLHHCVYVGMAMVTLIALHNAAWMWWGREAITQLYTDDLAVAALAAELLLLAGIFQLSDGLQVGANGLLRGMKDTRTPMLVVLISYWVVALLIGCALGFGWGYTPMGAAGFWIGLVAGLTCAALLLNLRLASQLKRFKKE